VSTQLQQIQLGDFRSQRWWMFQQENIPKNPSNTYTTIQEQNLQEYTLQSWRKHFMILIFQALNSEKKI